jgi:predicted acylesterase/phospholipase RssA
MENIEDQIEQKDQEEIKDQKEKTIKHIILSGGGIAGFSYYGALKETAKQGLWDIHNIQTFYGTSVGAMFATILSLKYDWDTLDDYIIKRPWHTVYNFDMEKIFQTFQTKGIFNKKVVENTLLPVFKGKDVPITATMKEFYDIIGIELHLFSTNINTFEIIDFSYKTHPNWQMVDVVYASCALPILMQPLFIDNICYSDGGFFANYPVKECINNGADPDEILGITRTSVVNTENNRVHEQSSLIDYIFTIFYNVTERLLNNRINQPKLKYEIEVECPPMSLYDIYIGVSNIEERRRLVNVGVDVCKKYAFIPIKESLDKSLGIDDSV